MMDLMQVLSLAVGDEGAERFADLRRPPRHSDEALTGTTRAWLRRLPPGCRPMRLAAQFPRVANGLAWCWADAAKSGALLEDLLVDHRGGRRGFPRAIVAELRRLQQFHDGGRVEPEGWWGALRRTLG